MALKCFFFIKICLFEIFFSFNAVAWAQTPYFIQQTLGNGENPACSLVTVQGQRNQSGVQNGIGWIVLNRREESLYAVTPAHVVRGTGKIEVICQNKREAVSLVSLSPTHDLALLKFQKPRQELLTIFTPFLYMGVSWNDFFSPLLNGTDPGNLLANLHPSNIFSSQIPLVHQFIYFNPDRASLKMRDLLLLQSALGFSYVEPGNEKRIFGILSTSQNFQKFGVLNSLHGLDRRLLGPESTLSVNGLSLRPGMSGAPLFVHIQKPNQDSLAALMEHRLGPAAELNQQKYAMGMMVKTELNGVRGLAIPIEDIVGVIDKMLHQLPLAQTTDPYLSYETISDAQGLQDVTLLNIPLARQANWTIRNACDFETVSSGVYFFARGGDYGEGGDGLRRMDLEYLTSHSGQHPLLSAQFSAYRSSSLCPRNGVLLPDGRVLIGLKSSERINSREILSIDDLFGLAKQMRSQLPSYVRRYGIFENQNSRRLARQEFCSAHGKSRGGVLSFGGSLRFAKALDWRNRKVGYTRSRYAMDLDSSNGNHSAEIECLSSSDLRLRLSQPGATVSTLGIDDPVQRTHPRWATPNIEIDFSASRDRTEGVLKLTNPIQENQPVCEVPIRESDLRPSGPWMYSISSDQLKINIELSLGPRLLHIDILKLPEHCERALNVDSLWLGEIEFFKNYVVRVEDDAQFDGTSHFILRALFPPPFNDFFPVATPRRTDR